jgi:alkylation response protein AidB-like acyl-CoA dehydrogenase
MNFEPDQDLAIFLAAIDRLAAKYRSSWTPGTARHQHAVELERELAQGGYFATASEESLGLVAATAMVYELSQLPVCAEIAASSLIGPLICPDMPTPIAVIWGDAGRTARYLPSARTVLWVGQQGVSVANLKEQDVAQVESLFAYPMGNLRNPGSIAWRKVEGEQAARVRDLWRLGVAAEIAGCLQAGLDAVVAHVTERRQFGRPLGSFQAIQHRLAAAASAIQGGRWLSLKAAYTGAAVEAATAAAYAQGISTRIVYDLHQFMGAMGLTLEHPLHRWTYRVKLLRSDLGGAERQFQDLADLAWASA